MRALLFPALLFGPFLGVEAQNVRNDSLASVIAYWEPGDQRSYSVDRSKEGARAGRSTYVIALRVLDATDSTYQLEARFSALRVEAALPEDARERELFHRLLHAMEGLRVVLKTDETGIPMAVSNEGEVQEHARLVLQGILDLARDPAERQAIQATLGPVLDADVLAQDALDDLGNLLFPFGVAYITGRKEEVQAEVPNPLGGDPFGTLQEFTMTHLDTASEMARMRMDQRIDPKYVDDHIDALIASSGGEGLAGDARERLRRVIEGIQVNESMDIVVDLKGAWTTELTFVRETVVRGEREREQRHYRLRDKR